MKVKGNLQVSGTTEGITFTDGTTTFSRQPKLTFDGASFYIGGDTANRPKVYLKSPIRVLNFNTNNFYLTGTSNGEVMVNLKADVDYVPFEQETGAVTNSYLIPDAPYGMAVESILSSMKSGTASIGFYIVSRSAINKNGTSIPGLDPISLTSTTVRSVPSSGGTIPAGDALLLSVFAVSSAKNLRLGVRLKRT